IVELQKLGLELGDIDVTGTLGLASLAHQAQIEYVVNFAVVSERLLSRQRQTQRIGSAARRVLLIAGCAIRGTHGAALHLAASAVAIAQFNRTRKPLLPTVIEEGGRPGRMVTRAVTEILR